MKTARILLVIATSILLSSSSVAFGQEAAATQFGIVAPGSYQAYDIDAVNMQNGNDVVRIPLFSLPQRGKLSLSFSAVANTTAWKAEESCSSDGLDCEEFYDPMSATYGGPPPTGSLGGGLFGPGIVSDNFPTFSWTAYDSGPDCPGVSPNDCYSTYYTVYDGLGGGHALYYNSSDWSQLRTTDGSGFLLKTNSPNAYQVGMDGYQAIANALLVDPNGISITNLVGWTGPVTESDPNGNTITISQGQFQDSIGRIVPSIPQATSSTAGCPNLNAPYQAAASSAQWVVPGPNDSSVTYLICYTNIAVHTNFWGDNGQSYLVTGEDGGEPTSTTYEEYNHTGITVIQSIVLPNGSYWGFVYDAANPSDSSSFAYGNITKIVYPEGGSISYGYELQMDICAAHFYPTYILNSRTVSDAEGHSYPWNYDIQGSLTGDNPSFSTVTDPSGNDTFYTYSNPHGCGHTVETQHAEYQGSHTSGTLLRSVATNYSLVEEPHPQGGGSRGFGNALPQSVVTTLDDGKTTTTTNGFSGSFSATMPACYDVWNSSTGSWDCDLTSTPAVVNLSLALPSSVSVGDYNSTTLKTTATTYEWQDNGSYLSANLLKLPALVTIKDGNGSQVAATQYGYDEANYGPQGIFGNQTSVSRWLNTTNTYLKTTTAYNSYGMPTDTWDANVNAGQTHGNHVQTTYDSSHIFPSQVQQSTTDSVQHIDYYSYDQNTGNVNWHTDQNGSGADDPNHTTTYTYDDMGRATIVQYPDGGSVKYCYTDEGGAFCSKTSAPFSTYKSIDASPDPAIVSHVSFDGLARVMTVAQPSGATVDYTYDGLGRLASTSNPHFGSTSSSDGTETYGYDAIGRKKTQTDSDGVNTQSWSYTGNTATYTDENTNQWTRTTDALGRLTKVLEPNGSGRTPTMQTDYSYDALDNLTDVTQWGGASGSSGARTRSFVYDSLSRLTSSTNSESGTTGYGYDPNGNMTSKTDARGITTTLTYDNLNRLKTRTYSDGVTPDDEFGYDGNNEAGDPISGLANSVGHLSHSSNENDAASTYSYDPMGRVALKSSCVPGDCTYDVNVAASYNAAGQMRTLTNGSVGRPIQLTYGYDSAGRLQSLSSNWYPDCNHPETLYAAGSYGPVGLLSATLGQVNSGCSSTTTNEVTETRAYDNRMRVASGSYAATALQTSSATHSTGTISVSGSEQSTQINQTSGSVSITINGSEKSTTIQVGCGPYGQMCPYTIYDGGNLQVTVNGFSENAGYNSSSTGATIASALASAFNGAGGSPVTAWASSNVLTLTAKATGTGSNYSFSASVTGWNSSYFSSPSFSPSPSAGTLSGGGGTTVYDTGTISASINGCTGSYSWGQNDHDAWNVAGGLASSISQNCGSLVTVNWTGGSSFGLTSVATGSSTDWPITVSVTNTNSNFSSPSFTNSLPQDPMSRGYDPGYNPNTAYSYMITPSAGTSGYDPVGNVMSVSDSVMGSWTFQYDTLNRLVSTGQALDGPYNGQYGCWAYDAFGNRTMEAIPSNIACSNSPTPTTWATYNTANRITGTNLMTGGDVYDAAGNITNDGANRYLYDGAGRICATQPVTGGTATAYIYDAEGNRVAKGTLGTWPSACPAQSQITVTAQYVVGLNGEQLTENDLTNGSMSWDHTNVFGGGGLLATYSRLGNDTYFALADWLGTKRAETSSSGCLESYTSFPFGDGPNASGNCTADATEHHFTGKEHDQESGNDYFKARYFASITGRFVSPDWSAQADPVPYAKLDNPQSLNLYSYVFNNPLTSIDADGHGCDKEASNSGNLQVSNPTPGVGPSCPPTIQKTQPSTLHHLLGYFYIKTGGGTGFGVNDFKIGPAKVDVISRTNGTEVTQTIDGKTVATGIKELGVTIGVESLKVGLERSQEDGSKPETVLGFALGKFEGSNAQIGLGAGGCLVGCFQAEVGIQADKVARDVSHYVDSLPSGGDAKKYVPPVVF